MPFLYPEPALEVECHIQLFGLLLDVYCLTNNPVSEVSCSYDEGPAIPCELLCILALVCAHQYIRTLMSVSSGVAADALDIGGFSPGDHSLDITVTDVFGQSVTHPRLTFTRPPLLVVECSANSLTVDCSNTTVVESQTCSIDGGTRFDCSLPLDISELAETYSLSIGEHELTITTVDVFTQSDFTRVLFNVNGKSYR